MSYKDLQAKAKELGLKYVGISEKDLKLSIAKKTGASKLAKPQLPKPKVENFNKDTNVAPPLEPKTDKEVTSLKEKDADAVVYQGKRKIRTYTLERHGKDYVKLAKQYTSHPEREGYEIKFETVETRLTCPYCHKKFRYN